MANRQYKQGFYEVQNKDKYLGKKDPRYLSSYELEVFKFCDRSPSVTSWGAEVVIVPYYSTVKQRKARYIVDVYVEYIDKENVKHKLLVEIKPTKDLKKPEMTHRKKKETFIQESLTWQTNKEKWTSAYKYAEERGWKFCIWTEREIFG